MADSNTLSSIQITSAEIQAQLVGKHVSASRTCKAFIIRWPAYHHARCCQAFACERGGWQSASSAPCVQRTCFTAMAACQPLVSAWGCASCVRAESTCYQAGICPCSCLNSATVRVAGDRAVASALSWRQAMCRQSRRPTSSCGNVRGGGRCACGAVGAVRGSRPTHSVEIGRCRRRWRLETGCLPSEWCTRPWAINDSRCKRHCRQYSSCQLLLNARFVAAPLGIVVSSCVALSQTAKCTVPGGESPS